MIGHAMRWARRLRWAWVVRTWPWQVPWAVVDHIGTTRPPEAVFEHFRKLHGIDVAAGPGEEGDGS